ncbi:hypothetical protein USDA257_c18110 [Sinorhizobium fredii USDA 257]|uniref:Uncharacterized protein n=1 Tax=Sinorhizobium fredii (strain USDA 257) TaxID=1185652 RepID=I3X3D2_SINF2|nr:hypothetical protein USDA257_c18010 [Sinorhizobium fredii USDA 257]AFL50398.1 hypothetical protein USDA257_c18110 [Sinorhizobium fredii USDA 257]
MGHNPYRPLKVYEPAQQQKGHYNEDCDAAAKANAMLLKHSLPPHSAQKRCALPSLKQ